MALALRLHTPVDGLAVLLRQVGAPDASIDDGDAEALRLGLQLRTHRGHELGPLVTHDIDGGGLAQHAPQRRVEQSREPCIGALDRADGLIEPQGSLTR